MLKLRDFHHLPQFDPIFEEITRYQDGLLVVAGVDTRSIRTDYQSQGLPRFTPSGRLSIFNVLLNQIVETGNLNQAVVVTRDKFSFKPPRELKRRFKLVEVDPRTSYRELLLAALRERPGLLVIDELNRENLPLAAEAALEGIRVAAQLDSILWGAEILRHLVDLGLRQEYLSAVRWVLSVQRFETLCQRCRLPDPTGSNRWKRLQARYPFLERLQAQEPSEGSFSVPGSCEKCAGTGRLGSIAAFDALECDPNCEAPFEQESRLPLEDYFCRMAQQGLVPLEDLERLEKDYLRRSYSLLAASEASLDEKSASLHAKVAELEAVNRVMVQRSEALVSLQNITNALMTSATLEEFSARLCRRAAEICGADRSILYYLRSLPGTGPEAEILAVKGWDSAFLRRRIPAWQVRSINRTSRTLPYRGWPPGIEPEIRIQGSGRESMESPEGLSVPLAAQGNLVGLMLIQSTRGKVFAPGEIALLQSFASQAALAIQREGLVEELREKIAALEAAQAELVQKERLERELELARQVQQSVLPKTFPKIQGYTFAALNQPARQVGGDFYDVIPLDNDHFGLLIGDVSDKGMPAALFMAISRSLMLVEARRSLSPREVLLSVNRLLLELGEPSQFVAVFYGVVQASTGILRYARAGHDRPIMLRQGEIRFLEGEGMVIGVLDSDELRIDEAEIGLLPGDRLALYTDGLYDITNSKGEFLGIERLSPIMSAAAPLPFQEFCETVFYNLLLHQGEADQYDDMTLVVVEYLNG